MKCELMEELISCYADGMLDRESAELVERHLDCCGSCRELLELTRRMCGACGAASEEPPADLRACVMEHVRNRMECERFEADLALAPDEGGALSAGLSAHLRDCRWCADELEQLSRVAAAAAGAEEPAPAGLRERIASRTYARVGVLSVIRRAFAPSFRYVAAGAAACALAFAALSLREPSGPGPSTVRVPVAPPAPPAVATQVLPESAAESADAGIAESAPAGPARPARRSRLARSAAREHSRAVALSPSPTAPAARPSAPQTPAVEETIVLFPADAGAPAGTEDGDGPGAAEPVEVRPVAVAIASPHEVLERHIAEDPLNTGMKEILEKRRMKAAATATLDPARPSGRALKLIATDF